MRVKWLVLGAGALVVLYAFESIFGKSIPDYIVTELALNQAGAETRLDQITYGLKEVWRHPMFGIGLNVARLPFWRSDIFDNFWLHTAVRFGIPAFLFIVGAFALHFLCVTLSSTAGPDRELLRIGYAFPFVTLVLLIGSISVWGSVVVFIMAYLGAGAWFYNGAQDPPAPAPREGRREPAPRRQPPPRRAAVSPGAAPRRAGGGAAQGSGARAATLPGLSARGQNTKYLTYIDNALCVHQMESDVNRCLRPTAFTADPRSAVGVKGREPRRVERLAPGQAEGFALLTIGRGI